MKDNTKKTLKYYWQNMCNYKVAGLVVSISIIGATSMNSIIPLYFKNFFNLLTGNQSRNIIISGLITILITIGILELVKWFFWRIAAFINNFYQSKIMADLSNQCFTYLHKHSFAYFSNNFTGSMVKRSKSFVTGFEVLYDQFFYELLPTFVTVSMITVILARLNLFLGLSMLFGVICFLTINWVFTKYKLKYDIQRSEAETSTTGFLADTITNNTNVKLFNGLKFEVKGFFDLNERLRNLRKFTWNLRAKFDALQSFLMIVLEIGIFYFAVKLWDKNIITVGDFVLIQSYILSVMFLSWDFGKVIRRIYEYLAEAEEMTVILNTPHEIVDVVGASNLDIKAGKIEYRGVSFSYDKGRKIINNLDLVIKAEETVALIGPSGAGKTTLVKLLLRMHDINKGQILIDGQDISKVTQESLRQNISLVPQDPILFHRSLMENIRYGKFDATDEEVIAAAKLAHCHEFISSLKEGYGTYVGERGIKLSGGERQRVAIARAILRNAPILVLDEATSSLDSVSEFYIQEALKELMKNKTVIVIAHRLSTIKKADRILVVDAGKISEEGSHNKLMKSRDGIYKKLWEFQVGGFIQ
ncbi:MAG: ABC transporter ATP-binding protein [Candidatus Shapirobacteria bacterium]